MSRKLSGALVIGCGVICAGALAGCGGSHRLQADGRPGYLYRYGNGESFLQWHRHGQKVHGTIRTTGFPGFGPARVFRDTTTFKGTISGSKFVLHQSNGNPDLVATLHSYGLLVVNTSGLPRDIGVRYRRATVADYNAAAAQTKAAVERQKARQAAEQAAASSSP
jgi:hypothetical protein